MKPEDYSDLGEAKVLAREFGNELRYTSATDLLRFDGQCWQEDKQLALGASLISWIFSCRMRRMPFRPQRITGSCRNPRGG